MTGRQQMTQLCQTFPILQNAAGVKPWDPEVFARWASNPISDGEEQAAAFVLSVWNAGTPADGGWWNEEADGYCVGRFDPIRAMFLWDAEQKAAFVAWCQAPFWP